MASSSSSRLPIPHLAFDIITPIIAGKHNYVPEPPMKEEKAMIWLSQVLVSFSIFGIIHAFLGPFPTVSEKQEQLKKFFPCHHGHKTRLFQDKAYELQDVYFVLFLLQRMRYILHG